jgi:uncharacterized protein
MSRMHTSTGRQVDPLDLKPEDVCVEDIAHHLSQTCRFNGATPMFYSVAEHAVHVAGLVEYHAGPVAALVALHHDDAEAYLGDQIRPVKSFLGFADGPLLVTFDAVEDVVQSTISFALELTEHKHLPGLVDLVKRADNAILAAELRSFWGPSTEADALDENRLDHTERIQGWSPSEAKHIYLAMHQRLAKAVADA